MRAILFAGLLMVPAAAAAEVVSADPHAFEVSTGVNLVVPVGQAYAAFSRIGAWWSGEHGYSGKAANMRLSLQPGGCFCESLENGGGVEHLRVGIVQPGERIVMTGALGPVLFQAASGVLDVKFERIAGGSRVTMDYRAAGFARGDADKMAPLVDAVLTEQMKRFRAFAAKGGGK